MPAEIDLKIADQEKHRKQGKVHDFFLHINLNDFHDDDGDGRHC